MSKHQDLTGRGAVHPFAFVQGTDPSLDPDNAVDANKAWIDTSSGATLKIRNAANNAWLEVLAGEPQVSQGFFAIAEVVTILVELFPLETQITHV